MELEEKSRVAVRIVRLRALQRCMKTQKAVFLLTLTTLFAGASVAFAQGVQNCGAETRGAGKDRAAQHLRVGGCGYECDGTGPGMGYPRKDGSGRLEKECPENVTDRRAPRRDGSGRIENERKGNPQGNGTPRRDRSGDGQGNGRGKGNGGNCPRA